MVVSPLAIWLVITGHNSATGTQQLHFRSAGDEPFHGIEHLNDMPALTGNQPHPHRRAAMQILRIHLRHGHVEAPSHLGHQRPNQ